MGRSDVLEEFGRRNGLRIWYWSNERGHAEEPHFHVKKTGEWEIRVLIDTTTATELAWRPVPSKSTASPPSRLLRELAGQVDNGRPDLLAEWERNTIHER